jgi:type II secretory pathway pseudopilin PulG
MSQALKTDVSILSLAYGRREPHTPTARVIEPAKGIAPAEGKGNLYILVELDGDDRGLGRLYRDLLAVIQETYYLSEKDITGALTAALRTAHTHLQKYNQVHLTAYSGGVTCLVATGSEIISAQAGPTILAVRSSAGLQWFSPLNDENYVPLGDEELPSIEIGRVAGHPGVVIVAMNSAWANYLEVPLMLDATRTPQAQAVADQMAGIGADAQEALAVLVVTLGEEPKPAVGPAPVATASAAAVAARPRSAIPAAKPSRWEDEEAYWDGAKQAPQQPQRQTPDKKGGTAGAMAGLGARLRRPEQERPPKKAKPAKKKRPVRRIPFVLAIVVILALSVAAIAAGTWYYQGQQRIQFFTEFMNGARVNLEAARSATDENQARRYLEAAGEQLDQAEQFAPEHPDIITLRAEIAETTARINHVQPLLAGFDQPLLSFTDPDRNPHDVLVHGLNVYVLDTGRDVFERYQLDEATGDRLAGDGAPELLLQSGVTVGGRRTGELAEAVWAPAMSNRTSSGPLVLDRSNQLFEISDALGPVNVALAENSNLGFVQDVNYYSGNLYLMDTTHSQLWRYRPSGESYTIAPEPYFAEDASINLNNVIDLTIDGSIWLLHPNGTVLKYFSGIQESFALDDVNPTLSDAVAVWANDVEGASGHLYIADAGSDRILVFDKQGKLLQQLTPVDHPGVLKDLQDIYVDEVSNFLYALTKSGLYQVPLPPIETNNNS